jgi:uncharacterized protein (TIGR02646 family)
MMRVFATTSPRTADCLALWEDEASGARHPSQDEHDALIAIEQRVGMVYKKAAGPLLDTFGSFCAYCELPLKEQIDVEHMVPKSEYPTFALSWDNFVAACGSCNTRKRANPSRQLVRSWLTGQSPTPSELHREIRQKRYRWPDLDDTYHLIGYELEYVDSSGSWTACPALDAIDPGNRYVTTSVVRSEVRANLPTLGLEGAPVRVVVADRADGRAGEMIKLCGLDQFALPRKTADRRSLHRTEAWFTAVNAWHEEVPDPTHPPPELRATFRASAAAVGFYSVWLTVAQLIAQPLANLFVNQTRSEFPGTDLSRVP